MVEQMMSRITVNEHILDDCRYDPIFSVEEVNRLTLEGTPFRDAYKQVGLRIEAGDFTPNKDVHHTHEGSIGNLCNEQISSLEKSIVQDFDFGKTQAAFDSLLSRKSLFGAHDETYTFLYLFDFGILPIRMRQLR